MIACHPHIDCLLSQICRNITSTMYIVYILQTHITSTMYQYYDGCLIDNVYLNKKQYCLTTTRFDMCMTL